MWTDSHCHLADETFAGETDDLLNRAHDAGVTRIVAIGCQPGGFGPVRELVRAREGVVAALGLHPEVAGQAGPEALEELLQNLEDPAVRAVGEVGLDYHWGAEHRADQKHLLEAQVEIAETRGLPLVIHERDAWEDLLGILSGVRTKVLLHCFSHSVEELDTAMHRGWYVAFGGIATFRSAGGIREAARSAPSDRFLIETDAPYLSPHPFRGMRNEPSRVAITGTFLAEVRGTTPEAMASATTRNALEFFGSWMASGEEGIPGEHR